MTPPVVHLLDHRRFDPPLPVEVARDGRWWPGLQTAWRLCDDERDWRAEVRCTVDYEWGREQHLAGEPADRGRLPSGAATR